MSITGAIPEAGWSGEGGMKVKDLAREMKGTNPNEEEEKDDAAELLQRARSLLEELSQTGSATLYGMTDGDSLDARKKHRKTNEKLWRRLHYLEWLVGFLEDQQHAEEYLQLMAVAIKESKLSPNNASLVALESKADKKMGAGSTSKCTDSMFSFSPDRNKSRDTFDGVALDADARPHIPSSTSNVVLSAVAGETPDVKKHMTEVDDFVCGGVDETVQTTCGELQCSQQQERQEKQQREDGRGESDQMSSFRTWFPSEISLLANVPQPHGSETSPVRHILCLSTVVHQKPRGMKAKNNALLLQGRYCKSCLRPLRKSYLPFPSWKSAKFCYYTGMYYCKNCHSGKKTIVPAYVLHFWDFKPLPVCNDAIDFLELQWGRPLLCVSAVNPTLYHHVVLLEMLRCLRLQIMELREIGVQCSVFQWLFYQEDAALTKLPDFDSQNVFSTKSDITQNQLKNTYFVPREKRYLMEDSEIWSMRDLLEVYRSLPGDVDNDSSAFGVSVQVRACSHAHSFTDCNLFLYLRRLRLHMASHILQDCCALCLRNTLDVCRCCCPAEVLYAFKKCSEHSSSFSLVKHAQELSPHDGHVGGDCARISLYMVHSFDFLHVRRCPQCRTCYHKRCYEEMQCDLAGVMGCVSCREDALLAVDANNCHHRHIPHALNNNDHEKIALTEF